MIGGKTLSKFREIHEELKRIDRIICEVLNYHAVSSNSTNPNHTDFDNLNDLVIAKQNLLPIHPERFYNFNILNCGVEIRHSVKDNDYFIRCLCHSTNRLPLRDDTQNLIWRKNHGFTDYGRLECLDDAIHSFYDVVKEITDSKLTGQWSLF